MIEWTTFQVIRFWLTDDFYLTILGEIIVYVYITCLQTDDIIE